MKQKTGDSLRESTKAEFWAMVLKLIILGNGSKAYYFVQIKKILRNLKIKVGLPIKLVGRKFCD